MLRARNISRCFEQATLLVKRYDAVVANPPYMGTRYYSPILKSS